MEALTFGEFLSAFFETFTAKSFKGADFFTYLSRSEKMMKPIVDNAIMGRVLELLGSSRPEQVYNHLTALLRRLTLWLDLPNAAIILTPKLA